MKAQENRFRNLVEGIEQKQAERVAFHSKSYGYEILKIVSQEHHEVFFEQVTKMKEYVDLKIVKLNFEVLKEVQKFDVIATTITKLVEFKYDYTNNHEAK